MFLVLSHESIGVLFLAMTVQLYRVKISRIVDLYKLNPTFRAVCSYT
jgi:hypothetical protein